MFTMEDGVPWSTVHGYYADMGGFVIRFTSKTETNQQGPVNVPENAATSDRLVAATSPTSALFTQRVIVSEDSSYENSMNSDLLIAQASGFQDVQLSTLHTASRDPDETRDISIVCTGTLDLESQPLAQTPGTTTHNFGHLETSLSHNSTANNRF